MEHFFTLPVIFKDEELSLPGRMVTFGYTYKIYVILNEQEIVFERDEEMKFRSVTPDTENTKTTDGELTKAVIAALESLSEKSTVVFSYPTA